MPFCQRCGKEVAPDAMFCSACGQDLRTPVVRPGSAPLFVRPVIHLGAINASATLGQRLDLKRLSKSFGGAPIVPPNTRVASLTVNAPTLHVRFQNSRLTCLITETGTLWCSGSQTEEQARAALAAVLTQLKNTIRIRGEPTVQIRLSNAAAFFGRGIRIEALPDRVPDSLYVATTVTAGPSGPVPAVQGKYNRGGSLRSIASVADANAATRELNGRMLRIPHIAYWKVSNAVPLATMPRGVDSTGQMLRTGYVVFWMAAGWTQVRETMRVLGATLEREGLFTPLTPLEQIPAGGRDDPRAYDYFAEDPTVWGSQSAAP